MSPITFDLANFLTTLLGALVGGIISAAISYYFFMKSKPLEVLTSWMAHNMGEILVKEALPQFFGSGSINYSAIEGLPPDLDVPHLDKVIVNQIKNSSHPKLEILFRVSDHGWNFPMAEGVSVKDASGISYAAKNSIFGYMHVEIPILSNLPTEKYRIYFDMIDKPQAGGSAKSYQQSIEILLQ